MSAELWLPLEYVLENGSKVLKLLACEEAWQIVLSDAGNRVLVVHRELRDKWVNSRLIGERFFHEEEVDGTTFCIFIGKQEYLISSILHGPYPDDSLQANAFAIALRETRLLDSEVPLHDALYLEQVSRLLPTYTLYAPFDDKTVLGTWLSSGVVISVDSTRRLHELLKWMDVSEINTIIVEAGLNAAKGNSISKVILTENEHEAKQAHAERSYAVDKGRGNQASGARFILPGREELESFFNENVVDIINNEEKYSRMGISFPGAIVMHGPPGCGKTFAAERLVEYLDWPCFSIGSSSIGSPYIHDTSKKIAEVFDTAIENAPAVVMIDEMEAYLTDRSAGQTSGTHHLEEVAEFLRRMEL